MDGLLFVRLTGRMAVIALIACVFCRIRLFRNALSGTGTMRGKLYLVLFLGTMAIAGTYLGVPIKGAIANSRVIGAAMGGILGGPWVGLAAGLMGGVHRFFVGGFTALSCGLSTTVEGLFAGLVSCSLKRVRWQEAFAIGFVAEVIQMGIILALSRPFEAALELVRVISWPMILVNASGLAVFMLMFQDMRAQEQRIGAFHTHQALSIAQATLSHLKKGLTRESAARTAGIIMRKMDLGAVAITDRVHTLAAMGASAECDYPLNGRSMESGSIAIASRPAELGPVLARSELRSGVAVPLYCRGRWWVRWACITAGRGPSLPAMPRWWLALASFYPPSWNWPKWRSWRGLQRRRGSKRSRRK